MFPKSVELTVEESPESHNGIGPGGKRIPKGLSHYRSLCGGGLVEYSVPPVGSSIKERRDESSAIS